MLIVTGSVTARPETFDALLRAALDHVHRSRAEPGCVAHGVYADCEDPLKLFFYEEWADRPALDAHFAQAGSNAFMAAVRELAARSTPLKIMPLAERRYPYDRRL
jgi:quinol monooxygenase YgiN